jgi:hypothetical protein
MRESFEKEFEFYSSKGPILLLCYRGRLIEGINLIDSQSRGGHFLYRSSQN